MTGEEYRRIIKHWGYTQAEFSQWLGVSERTGQRYAANGPPRWIELLMNLMVYCDASPELVDRINQEVGSRRAHHPRKRA